VKFYDVLHGQFDLGLGDNAQLVQDLLECPELQRLRHMRQMNFDPHSIGVAYLAEKLSSQYLSSAADKKALIVAALLHDAAIPPYGHLVEYYLKKEDKSFNHEVILEALIHGDYHSGNTHHQLLPGASLKVADTLNRHKVDQKKVLSLVRPITGSSSAISADIDLDNIDNVHRMAILMGWNGVKKNIKDLIAATKINQKMALTFEATAKQQIEQWQDYRQKIYTFIIGNPLCVAHNAFQSKLVQLTIENRIITTEGWYITEPEFEEEIRKNKALEKMGGQLLAGPNYALIDYVWFKSFGKAPIEDWGNIESKIRPLLPELGNNHDYFFWVEKKLICREISFNTSNGQEGKLGTNSISLFISKVHTDA